MKRILVLASVVLLTCRVWGRAAVPPSPWLNFALQPAEIQKGCRSAQDRTEDQLKALAQIPDGDRNFGNTAFGFEEILQEYADATTALSFLSYVSTDAAVRDAAHACETQAAQYLVGVYAREDLYHAVKAGGVKVPPLKGEDAKLLDKIILEFKRNGLELPSDKRQQVKQLKQKLVDLELTFGKNIRDYKDSLAVSKQQLAGLPDDYIRRLSTAPGEMYLVTLEYPDYFPFMENAKDGEARRELELKFDNRASTTNVHLIEQAIDLRRQIANLLGYPTWADYVLEDRMAKSPAEVTQFLQSLREKLKPKAEKELKDRLALKEKDFPGKPDPILHAWEWRYYNNQIKKLKYEIDQEKIKEYFPLDVVVDGMLNVYQRLLGVRFQQVPDPASWHPDVPLYEVHDAGTNELIGYFYMDLFPREGKYEHAASFDIVKAHVLPDGTYQKPVSAIVANFNKPTPDQPSLLLHEEVVTLFHEFGHIMHQVLTKAKYGRFSGSSVSQDFVEAPSQMLENWVWDADILKSLSGYYKDHNRKLPVDLLKRMAKAKNFDSGLRYLRQDFFATLDMAYHTAPGPVDTTAVYEDLMGKISLIPMSAGTHPQASFDHLMGGYDAGYYGYLWSEVYSADMFSLFKKKGLLNPALGMRYRRLILEPGRSRDEMDELKEFLGRAPNQKAFLKSIGL